MRQLLIESRRIFRDDQTFKGLKNKKLLKPKIKPIQQNTRPVALHLQETILTEIQQLH